LFILGKETHIQIYIYTYTHSHAYAYIHVGSIRFEAGKCFKHGTVKTAFGSSSDILKTSVESAGIIGVLFIGWAMKQYLQSVMQKICNVLEYYILCVATLTSVS
jgi:hypothetical protein